MSNDFPRGFRLFGLRFAELFVAFLDDGLEEMGKWHILRDL